MRIVEAFQRNLLKSNMLKNKNNYYDICMYVYEDEIGGLTQENVKSECIQPVAAFLERQVDEWMKAKFLETKLTVGNETFTGYFGLQ